MGDDFVRYGFPFVDLNAGGSVEGMTAAMEEVLPRLPADVKVIPGHGAVSNVEDVRQYIVMLKETRAAVDKGIKQGKTLAQLKQEKVLAPVAKMVRRLHHHRRLDRDPVQRPDRRARPVHEAQLTANGQRLTFVPQRRS